MPNSLENQFISDGYVGQLHLGFQSLSSGGPTPVFDGLGNISSLSVGPSGTGATVTGALTAGNIVYPSVQAIISLINYLYPVGSVFLSFSNTNPSVRFVGTSWTQVSQGRVLVGTGTGVDGNNTSVTFAPGSNTNGDYTTTLTSDQVPDHYHYVAVNQTSTANGARANLDSESYVAWERNPAGFGTFEYRLDGLASVANVGRTSGVVRSQAISGITTTNPSYGLYVWLRTS
jgi:hypothetical protein